MKNSERLLYFLALILLLPTSEAFAQEEDSWEYLLSTAFLQYHGTFGDTIRFGSQGGVIKVHKGTLEAKWLTKLNSGLSNQSVRDYVQDFDGVDWYPTRYKISSFDGADWTVYDEANTGVPIDFGARTVTLTPDNKKVFTSSFGLASFDGMDWELYNSENTAMTSNNASFLDSSPNGTIYYQSGFDLYIFNDGNVFPISNIENGELLSNSFIAKCAPNNDTFIPSSSGLGVLSNGSITIFNSENSELPSNFSSEIAVDNQSRLWMQDEGQTLRYANGEIETLPTIPGKGVYPLSGNQAYFVGEQNEIQFYDNGTISSLGTPFYSPYSTTIVHVEENGNIWAQAQNAGVYHYDGVEWQMISVPVADFPTNFVFDLALDSEGNPWFAFIDGDVDALQNGEWTRYYSVDVTSFANGFTVKSVARWDDKMVFTTNGSIGVVEDGSLSSLNCEANDDLCDLWFNDAEGDSEGNLWIQANSFSNEFAIKYDGSTFTFIELTFESSTSPNQIIPISGEEFYILSGGEGFVHYENGVVQSYTTQNSPLPSDYVNHLIQINDGTLWIATREGLVKKDGDEWTNYDLLAGLGLDEGLNDIMDIAIDADGVLWLAARGLGLVAFDGVDGWQSWTLENSDLIDAVIRDVEIDPNGVKWIGTMWGGATFVEGELTLNTRGNTAPKTQKIAFPNPTTEYFEILEMDGSSGRVEVSDINGRVIKTWERHISRYDISDLESGIYLVRWMNAEGSSSIKIVKR